MYTAESLRKVIKAWIIIFVVSLIFSGITAFALETELAWVNQLTSSKESALKMWINKVYPALHDTNLNYPFLAYGYDWLALAHLVIAVAFIGPLKDPVKNKWVIQFGMIACCMIFPVAFIAGHFRGIPVFWQLIDCSFAVVGLIPLCICYKKIKQLEQLINRKENYAIS